MSKLTDEFSISSTLFENVSTIIYRAVRRRDSRRVILKTHKQPEDAHLIKHEYDLLKDKTLDGVSNVLDLFNNNEDPIYLVSEDCGAVVLEDYLADTALGEMDFLRLAENAALSLAAIHRQNILHLDVKPANMLVDPDSLQVWYIDFGISRLVERGAPPPAGGMKGTLEYLSPEQTGRIFQAIDARSDIYSLGVTLYKLLTGRLPFTGANAMELIHAHIAIDPVPPGELAATQPIISDGIRKMLAKNPEDRYQTAESLAYDIGRCRKLLLQGRDCNRFLLAEKDIFYNLEPGRKLYGKADTLASLNALLDGVDDKKTQLVLLSGGEAVGKTMILDEFERAAASRSCLLFRAEYEQLDRSEPYYALRSVFGHFEAQVYGSKISLSAYRRRILEQLEGNAASLIRILPQLEGVLGEQPPVPPLGPVETQMRSELVFRVFMQVITDVPCPCVFILDNAQWADEASLRLLFSAMDPKGLPNCMVVFAFQDEERAVSDRLHHYIKHLNLRYTGVTPLQVRPLSQADIAAVVDDVFPMPREKAAELVKLAFHHSDGSMRRLEGYLKSLYHSGALRRGGDGRWDWEPSAVGPEAVHDLDSRLLEDYQRTPADTRHCLGVLACLGAEFSREWIEIAFGGERTVEQVLAAMAPVMELGHFGYNEKIDRYAFAGGRTRALAYAALPEDERRELHYRIGKRLYHHYENEPAALLANCTAITDQFNRSGGVERSSGDRLRVFRMNHMAGDEAMGASNLEGAARFYAIALSLLERDPLREQYDLALGLYMRYAACLFALGDVETATRYYRDIMDNARNEEDRYQAYLQLIQRHLSITDWIRAEAYAREYMAGAPEMPDESEDLQALIDREREIFAENADATGLPRLVDIPPCADPVHRRRGSMLALLAEAAVADMDDDALYFIYKALNYAYRHGAYPALEHALAMLAERCANAGEYENAKNVIECGIAYAERHQAGQSVLWSVYTSTIIHWLEPLSEIPAAYQKAKHIAMMEGSLYYGAFADLMLLSYNLFTGVELIQFSRDVDAAIHNAQKSGYTRFELIFRSSFRQFVRCMTGKTDGWDSFDDRSFSEAAFEAEENPVRRGFNAQIFYASRMQALYTAGYYEQVVEYGHRLLDFASDGRKLNAFLPRVQFYYYYLLAMLRLCGRDRSLLGDYMPIIRRHMEGFRQFAEAQPQNFACKYNHLQLELKRLNSHGLSLLREYSDVDFAFRENGYRWDRALVEERLMEFWEGENIAPQYQDIHRANATALYKALGARIKTIQLDRADKPVVECTESLAPTTTVYTTTGLSLDADSMDSASLDYQAILSVIHCLASEDNIDQMLEQLLTLLMRNAGADQALLFLLIEDEIHLRAFRYADRHTQGLLTQELPLALAHIGEDVLPHRIVELAVRKSAPVVANAADNTLDFLGDQYLIQRRPESYVCLPVVAKGVLIGAVYLENARLPGVFPRERVAFLSTILLQASVLIRNALEAQDLELHSLEVEQRLRSHIDRLNTRIADIAQEIRSPLEACAAAADRLRNRSREALALRQEGGLSASAMDELLGEVEKGLDTLSGGLTQTADRARSLEEDTVG